MNARGQTGWVVQQHLSPLLTTAEGIFAKSCGQENLWVDMVHTTWFQAASSLWMFFVIGRGTGSVVGLAGAPVSEQLSEVGAVDGSVPV